MVRRAGTEAWQGAVTLVLVRGEWFEWEWDETLFAGAAAYYDRGRLPNAPGLADAFEQAFGLDAEAAFSTSTVGRAR